MLQLSLGLMKTLFIKIKLKFGLFYQNSINRNFFQVKFFLLYLLYITGRFLPSELPGKPIYYTVYNKCEYSFVCLDYTMSINKCFRERKMQHHLLRKLSQVQGKMRFSKRRKQVRTKALFSMNLSLSDRAHVGSYLPVLNPEPRKTK